MPGTLEQYFQDLEGFFFEPDAHSVLAKFARVEIDFEGAETHYRGCTLNVVHWSFSVACPAPAQGCLLVLSALD